MKFSIKGFFSKCDQIRRKLRIWSHLLKKSLMENFIFGEVHESVKSAKAECPLEGLHNLTTPSLADLNFTIQIVASNEYSKLVYVYG